MWVIYACNNDENSEFDLCQHSIDFFIDNDYALVVS